MELTLLLGKVWSVYLLLAGLSLLLNARAYTHMVKEIKHGQFPLLIAGFMTLTIGLLMVFTHNVWTGWATIVTVLGWLSLLKGVVILLFPGKLMGVVHMWKQTGFLLGGGVVSLGLGVILGFLAF